jgi:hypothetical protein
MSSVRTDLGLAVRSVFARSEWLPSVTLPGLHRLDAAAGRVGLTSPQPIAVNRSFGWSMRPWQSVPRLRGGRRGGGGPIGHGMRRRQIGTPVGAVPGELRRLGFGVIPLIRATRDALGKVEQKWAVSLAVLRRCPVRFAAFGSLLGAELRDALDQVHWHWLGERETDRALLDLVRRKAVL